MRLICVLIYEIWLFLLYELRLKKHINKVKPKNKSEYIKNYKQTLKVYGTKTINQIKGLKS